jgi:hypothetical protein
VDEYVSGEETIVKYCTFTTLLLIAMLIVAVIPAHAAGDEPSDNALTRGNRFTVNITGLPSTPYYIWPTRTSP